MPLLILRQLAAFFLLLCCARAGAQENSHFIFWRAGAEIVSGEHRLVTGRGASFNGNARFAFRAASYPQPISGAPSPGGAYHSWHLELWAIDSIRTKQVVTTLPAQSGRAAYELAFYRGRFADPDYRSLLGKVQIPAERVKQVANGQEEHAFFYSIDLVDIPYYLWNNGRTDWLDIQRVDYVSD